MDSVEKDHKVLLPAIWGIWQGCTYGGSPPHAAQRGDQWQHTNDSYNSNLLDLNLHPSSLFKPGKSWLVYCSVDSYVGAALRDFSPTHWPYVGYFNIMSLQRSTVALLAIFQESQSVSYVFIWWKLHLVTAAVNVKTQTSNMERATLMIGILLYKHLN
jgi:hypothetical protein